MVHFQRPFLGESPRSLSEAYGDRGPRGEKMIWVPLSFDMVHRLVRRGVGWLGPVMPIEPSGARQGT